MKQLNHLNSKSCSLRVIILIIALGPFFLAIAKAQTNSLQELFSQAQIEPHLRGSFIESYVLLEGLPDYVLEILYSDEVRALAITNPLVQTGKENYRTTSHALAIGRGYPSRMTFGPRMFHAAFNYSDFHNIIQHEGAHAKFWATGKLNYLQDVDTSENSKVRLRGLFPILFELDAIKTQMDHPSWQETSASYRRGQETYRQRWLNKLSKLEQKPYIYDMKPLFRRIRRTYDSQ
jgi:hypothetical protein